MQRHGHRPLANTPALVAIGCGAYAIVAGVSGLLGWPLDMPVLTDWTSQGISMFPNTALCCALLGASLISLVAHSVGDRPAAIVWARLLAGAVFLISGLTLLEHVTGIDLGIDTLLFDRVWGQNAASAPMRMGPPATASFLILSVALILATDGARARATATTLAIVTTAIASLSLTGYWFGTDQFFGIAKLTGIAFNTSTVVAALSAGVMAAVPEYGLAAALSRDDAGGAVHRRLLAPIIAVPLVLGWLRLLGEQAGYYDTAFGTALRSLAEIILFFGLLWWTASSISWYASFANKANARLAAIIESSDDAIVSKTLGGIIETWNSGAVRIFGYLAEEAIGRHISLIIPPERIDEEASIISRLKRGERIEHFETVRRRKDGTRIRIALTVSPIRQADGQIIGASKIARDITDHLLVEERLRAVVDATPECVKIVAPDGTLEFMNHAGLCMIESDSELEVRGSSVYDLIAPEHRRQWVEHHQRVCSGEKLHWQFEIIGLKGTRRWMETHAVPLSLPDGRTAQLAVTRDITERLQMEREREELLESERFARAEAERASHLKDEFLATLSHELRTPLNAILGWSQLLSPNSNPAELEQGLEVIRRNVRAQTQLIEDLLDMSRIISGKVRLDVQAVDVAAVIEAAVESVAPAAEAKGIRLIKILDPHAGGVSGDPTRLQQVIWNLLTNAIKFTPKRGKIDVILERVNSHLEITVHDTGIGITPEYLPVVFERFRQADASTTRSHGGLGLGLSIVKHLVELHGGTVRVKSAGEGQGATFIVTLPLAPVRSHENRAHPLAAGTTNFDAQRVDLEGVKVLVVDDEPDARALIQRVLTHCGAEVCAAPSAADALVELRSFQPHVLVSDIGMPGTDGYQFLRAVRSLTAAEGGNTPAIALTAFARSEDRMRAMMAGYQVHVAKPIEPQELAVTVHSLSGRTGSTKS
jgi:PAS domain S-box-containing protein